MTHRGPFEPPPFCDSVILGPRCLESGWRPRVWESREQAPARHGNKGEVLAAPLIASENIKKEKRYHQEQCYMMHSGR